MNQTRFVRAFLFGTVFGFVMFWIYLRYTSNSEDTAEALGWLFFWPQHFIAEIASWFGAEEAPNWVSSIAVALYYGYLIMSVRLSLKVAASWFFISGTVFLFWKYGIIADHIKHGRLVGLLFLPAFLLEAIGCGVFLQWLSLSAMYAMFGCGVRTLGILFKGKQQPRENKEPI